VIVKSSLSIAIVAGALIIAAALCYHGRELAKVSNRLAALEQRSTGLEHRLDRFSSDLPTLVGEAGKDAGRRAFHGVVEEVFQNPLNWFRPAQAQGASNNLQQAISEAHVDGSLTNLGLPWIRFDIPNTVINVQILPQVKELPMFPRLLGDRKKQPSTGTNQDANLRQSPCPRPMQAEIGRAAEVPGPGVGRVFGQLTWSPLPSLPDKLNICGCFAGAKAVPRFGP
jgi:hypothetical protein